MFIKIQFLAPLLLLTCTLGLALSSPQLAAEPGKNEVADPVTAEFERALAEVREIDSIARQRLAVRRVIRDADKQLESLSGKPQRWVLLEFLFRAQQLLTKLDDDKKHRQALIETCRKLVEAPDQFAELRLEADLLLSQVEQAQKNASAEGRAEALRPFIARYVDTPAGAKALRLTMVMALELGNTRLVNDLREMIAERFSKDLEMITFLRDNLGGQVFGVPFVGYFKRSDGKTVCYPMDGLGHSSMVIFWSKEDEGVYDYLANIAAAAKFDHERVDGRLEFISVNLDELPDAGVSIIRKIGADWQVLHLPGGRESEFYKAYVRVDPLNMRVAPTGQTAMMMRESPRKPAKPQPKKEEKPENKKEEEPEKPKQPEVPKARLIKPEEEPKSEHFRYTESFRRTLIRSWSRDDYALNLSALMTGDFLIFEPEGDLEPTQPPELKAAAMGGEVQPLERAANSVPEETLKAIQNCLIAPPQRYHATVPEIRAGYQKMVELSRQAIADHPDAPDLWVVRNRLMIAFIGLWKTDFDLAHFEAAAAEAKTALETGTYPAGTDVIPRFCLARQALRNPEVDQGKVIDDLLLELGGESAPGPAFAVAALLALDVADQKRFQIYREAILREHTEYSTMWIFSSFLLDRYHDFWLFRIPFNAGWSFGRRLDYEMRKGYAEKANRMLNVELPTTDGKIFRIPEDLESEYTAIYFAQPGPWKTNNREDTNPPSPGRMMSQFPKFAVSRPDVDAMVAMLAEDDEQAIRESMKIHGSDKQLDSPILNVPAGLSHPVVQRLGLLSKDESVVLVDKQGRILTVITGIAFKQSSAALENTIYRFDELAINDALERGDIQAANDHIMALAPPYNPEAVDERGRKLRKPQYSTAHLRARARVYMALKEWDKALADAEEIYSRAFSQAGRMSIRTDELDESEALRDEIKALRDASDQR